MNVGPGDEVIVTGYTCSAVPEAVIYRGAKPIYCDISIENFSMNIDLITQLISEKTKVIIAQHTYGFALDMTELSRLTKEKDIYLIEDCALSLGSRDSETLLGSYGDGAIFSFELSKTISVGWGGIVHINHDNDLKEALDKSIKYRFDKDKFFGSQRLFQGGLSGLLYRPVMYYFFKIFIQIMFKLKVFKSSSLNPEGKKQLPENFFSELPDIQWYFLLKQYMRLEESILVRSEKTRMIKDELIKAGISQPFFENINKNISLIRFPILVQNKTFLINKFKDNGIEVGSWFHQPVSTSASMSLYDYEKESCNVAERTGKQILNLPINSRVKDKEICSMIKILIDYFDEFPDEKIFFT